MPASAYITWEGIEITTGWSMTLSPGIYPSQCTINSPPHSFSIEDYGNLDIVYLDSGDGGATSARITFTDCILEKPTLQSSGAKIWSIPILDRRWKWRHGHISGEYNRQKPNGDVIRRKTPQQLATMLLQAMGESVYGYDVSRLPNTSRPYRKWDFSNPAAELQSLCDELACDIVLNPFRNKVELWPIGEGPGLPAGVTIGGSLPLQAIQKPESILVVTQPVVFEATFELYEPVGIDTDGSVKKINDLSYTPAGGWGDLASFEGISGTFTDSDGIERRLSTLAESCVWRMYRIEGVVGGSAPAFEDAPAANSIDDLVLYPERVVSRTQSDGTFRPLPAKIETYKYGGGAAGFTDLLIVTVTDGFSIDGKRGLVIFSEPAFNLAADGRRIRSYSRLTTAYSILKDGVPYRWSKRYATGGRGGQRVVQAGGVARKVAYLYGGNTVIQTTDNLNDIIGEVEKARDLALKEYTPIQAKTLNYVGIKPITPNGVISQVTWSKQAAGAITTTASMAREHNSLVSTRKKQREKAQRERERDALMRMDEATKAIETLEATRFIA